MRGTLEVESQKEYNIHFVPLGTHSILTKWQTKLMSSSMDWEREFCLFSQKRCYTDFYRIGSFYAFILSRSDRVRLTVVARSNYEAVQANVRILVGISLF